MKDLSGLKQDVAELTYVVGGRFKGGPYLVSRPTLELGFDVPGQRGFAVLVENHVVAKGVDVFGIDEEAVHVKEAGSDFGETDSSILVWPYGNQHSHNWCSTGTHVLVLACCHFEVGWRGGRLWFWSRGFKSITEKKADQFSPRAPGKAWV